MHIVIFTVAWTTVFPTNLDDAVFASEQAQDPERLSKVIDVWAWL